MEKKEVANKNNSLKIETLLGGVEVEPNPPGMPEKLDLSIDQNELKHKNITETKGYQSWLKLLELVKNKDRQGYKTQALMHADTLKEGLQFLKTQGQDLTKTIQEQKDSPFTQQIADDFYRVLGTQDQGCQASEETVEEENDALTDLYMQAVASSIQREIDHQEREKRKQERDQKWKDQEKKNQEFLEKRRQQHLLDTKRSAERMNKC